MWNGLSIQALQADKGKLSYLLRTQKPRQLALSGKLGHYAPPI
jgi:hypothetical protein